MSETELHEKRYTGINVQGDKITVHRGDVEADILLKDILEAANKCDADGKAVGDKTMLMQWCIYWQLAQLNHSIEESRKIASAQAEALNPKEMVKDILSSIDSQMKPKG